MVREVRYSDYQGRRPSNGETSQRPVGNNAADSTVRATFLKRIEYEIEAGDGAYKMAEGLTQVARELPDIDVPPNFVVTPKDVVEYNWQIFEFMLKRHGVHPFDFDSNLHQELAAGPDDAQKIVSVYLKCIRTEVQTSVTTSLPYEIIQLNNKIYGIEITLTLTGYFQCDVLLATGFDDIAKVYFGLRIRGDIGGKYQSGVGWDTHKDGYVALIYGAEFAYSYLVGEKKLSPGLKALNDSWSPGPVEVSVKKLYGYTDQMKSIETQINKPNVGLQHKAAPDADFKFAMSTRGDTTIYDGSGILAVKDEYDIPIQTAAPTAVLRGELNGQAGGSGKLKLKVFELQNQPDNIKPSIQSIEKVVSVYDAFHDNSNLVPWHWALGSVPLGIEAQTLRQRTSIPFRDPNSD